MTTYRIAVIPGDGIGKEVVPEGLRVEEEPSLGSDAFSASGGWTILMVADRRGTAMILKLEALKVERADLQRFAVRVLDALPQR